MNIGSVLEEYGGLTDKNVDVLWNALNLGELLSDEKGNVDVRLHYNGVKFDLYSLLFRTLAQLRKSIMLK